MSVVLFGPEADEDLLDIARHIAAANPQAADRFIDAIHERTRLLADAPEIGRRREELAPRLRSFPAGRYVIFYRHIAGGIEVARLLHGARDIPALF